MRALKKIKSFIKELEYFLHETKNSVLLRFFLVIIVVLAYFTFVSLEYGLSQGFFITFLTWSFFVFCTPIADAGFLLDFPVRLITKIRMIYSETIVWMIVFFTNFYTIIFNPSIYETTFILQLFKHILFTPFPFWSIIVLSCMGTFLSIYFGDELMDVINYKERKKYLKHKNKRNLVVLLFLVAAIIVLYDFLLIKGGN